MIKTTKIEVTGEEILSMVLGLATGMTVEEFRNSGISIKSSNVRWEIKSEGDYDKGNYIEFLDKVIVEINE